MYLIDTIYCEVDIKHCNGNLVITYIIIIIIIISGNIVDMSRKVLKPWPKVYIHTHIHAAGTIIHLNT